MKIQLLSWDDHSPFLREVRQVAHHALQPAHLHWSGAAQKSRPHANEEAEIFSCLEQPSQLTPLLLVLTLHAKKFSVRVAKNPGSSLPHEVRFGWSIARVAVLHAILLQELPDVVSLVQLGHPLGPIALDLHSKDNSRIFLHGDLEIFAKSCHCDGQASRTACARHVVDVHRQPELLSRMHQTVQAVVVL